MDITNLMDLQIQLNICLQNTRKLRHNVANVVMRLSDGVSFKKRTNEEEKLEKDSFKDYLAELQTLLLEVNTSYDDVEKSAFSLNSSPTSFGNSSLLLVEPDLSRSPLYQHLAQTYKWMAKMTEYSTLLSNVLGQNTLKRSSSGLINKMQRRNPNASYLVQPHIVDNFMKNMDRYFQAITINISRPQGGSSCYIQLTIGRTLKVLMLLRGCVIEHILCKAFSENLYDNRNKLNVFEESRYIAFRQITDNATSTVLDLQSSALNEQTIFRNLFVWLESYQSVFRIKCKYCNRFLHNGCPPTWKHLHTMENYHDICRN